MLNVNSNGAGSGSINTRWQDVVLVAARALLQVPAAGVDLEANVDDVLPQKSERKRRTDTS